MERSPASHAQQRRRSGLPRPYVAVWVALSSMALTYLVTLSVRPDLAESVGEQVAALVGVEGRPAETGDERSRMDIAALRQGIDGLQREIAALRSQVAAREEREQAFGARLAAVEAQRVSEQGVPLATASVTRGPPEGPGSAIEGQIVEAPRAPELPTRRPPAPREVERVTFPPPQVKPAAEAPETPRGIQIATGPSVDALRISWMLLSDRHKEILRNYEPRFVPSTSGSGPAYRLIAGPIESTPAANRVCGELRARRVTCGVSAFGGEPL